MKAVFALLMIVVLGSACSGGSSTNQGDLDAGMEVGSDLLDLRSLGDSPGLDSGPELVDDLMPETAGLDSIEETLVEVVDSDLPLDAIEAIDGIDDLDTTGDDSETPDQLTTVLAIISNNNDPEAGMIGVFTISLAGEFVDTGLRLGPVQFPRAISMKPGGGEALVSWGNTGNGYSHGFILVTITGPGEAEITQTMELEGTFGPLQLSYTSPDSAVISRVGPGPHDLLPLVRGEDGLFHPGQPTPSPADFPQEVLPIPGQEHRQLMLQANLMNSGGSNIHAMSDQDGVITLEGEPIFLADTPMFFFMNPVVPVAYVPSYDPADQSEDPLNPGGLLHILAINQDGGWSQAQDYVLPHLASLAVFAPDGSHAIFSDDIRKPSGDYSTVEDYEFYRVELDSFGMPTTAGEPFATTTAGMVFDLVEAPGGHLVVSKNSSPTLENNAYSIVVLTRNQDDTWTEGAAVTLPGAAELAL